MARLNSQGFGNGLSICLSLCLSALALFGVYALIEDLGLDPIPFGSVYHATRGHAHFLAVWTFLGGLSAASLAIALARFTATDAYRSLADRLSRFELRDRDWIIGFSLLAFALPALVRVFVLQFAPLTDDEAIYRFAADLIASGRVAAPRPPGHLFWDRAFMVIDEHMYGQYFLGWPAVLAAFKLIGLEQLAACICSALTVAPLYGVALRVGGPGAARITAALFVLSPMLMIGSATLMSHAACLCANAWALWLFFKAREPDSKPWLGAAFALVVSIAFFIRPFTTLALCSAPVVCWLFELRRAEGRLAKLMGFGVISTSMAGLFLLANYSLTGDALHVPYRAALDYVVENHYRFGWFRPGFDLGVAGLQFDFGEAFRKWLGSLFRFSYAVGGWPLGLLFLPFARRGPVAVLWAVFLAHVGFHFPVTVAGIDAFGPPHYYELALPFLLLSGNGVEQLRVWTGERRQSFAPHEWIAALPGAAVIALLVTATLGFTCIRLGSVQKLAAAIRRPLEAIERVGVHNAVLFRSGDHATFCDSRPARHFVFWPPHNDPDMRGDVLWANHLTVEWDKALMRDHFPGRKGYIYFWKSPCKLGLVDLDFVEPGGVPDAPELAKKTPTTGPDD